LPNKLYIALEYIEHARSTSVTPDIILEVDNFCPISTRVEIVASLDCMVSKTISTLLKLATIAFEY